MLPPPPLKRIPIILAEAAGQLGNHLSLYALMLQLSISLDVDTYVNDQTYEYLRGFFTEESIRLKSLYHEFCNYDKIQWTFYYKHIRLGPMHGICKKK